MKEQRAAAARGTGYAILLHVVLIGLLLFGLHHVTQQGGDAGGDGALQADVASVNDLSAKTRRALLGEPKEAVQPLPQPVEAPQELPKPVETPVEKPVEPTPQPVVKQAPAEKPAPERPQPPVKTPPPKPQPTPVDMSKKVPTPEPAPAKKTTDSDLAARAAAEAARLAKATNLAKQRAEQMADARSPTGGNDQSSSSARPGSGAGKSRNSGQQKWLDAVGRAIEAKWLRPDDIPPGQACPIHIRIIPGGEVIAATVQPGCPYSDEAKRSVEKAVRDASPLPFKGYEDVYSRDFTANFKPSR